MESCEVLVVGGGPAGSTCAGQLRQAGLDVLLLDSRVFPREKPCAGWITPAVLETLAIDRDEYRCGRVFQEIRGFVTCALHGAGVETRYDRIVSYGIRRGEFDHYLLRRSSARQVLGEPVTSLERKGGGWIVNSRIRARLLVGAGGHSCPVARLLGAKVGAEEAVIAQSAEFASPGDRQETPPVRGDTPELYFSRDLKGYGWVFRKGEFLNVGFGRLGRADFGRHMAGFREVLERRGVVVPGSPDGFRGHAYLVCQGQKGRRRVDDGALLVGDSAGLALPLSGEGVLPAVESAILAAQTIVAANGDYCRDKLEPYVTRLDDRFGRESPEIPLPSGLLGLIGTGLLSIPPFVRHIVLDRWFLHRSRKGLFASP